jgi:hypothetical protein
MILLLPISKTPCELWTNAQLALRLTDRGDHLTHMSYQPHWWLSFTSPLTRSGNYLNNSPNGTSFNSQTSEHRKIGCQQGARCASPAPFLRLSSDNFRLMCLIKSLRRTIALTSPRTLRQKAIGPAARFTRPAAASTVEGGSIFALHRPCRT